MARIIALSGVVGWEITANMVREELAKANGSDVEFHGNSPGGFVYEAIEIFNLIRTYRGHTEFKIVGLAASAMSYIPLAANKVTAFDNATWMIHNAMNIVIGDHKDMRKAADVIESLTNILARESAKKTGKSFDEIKTLMDNETFMFGDEILKAGFIDEIIESPEDSDDDKASAFVRARASMDACNARMKGSDAANEDFTRAVAYIDGMSALLDPPKTKIEPAAASGDNIEIPAGAGNEKQEDKHMSLEALLADPANASAKAEYDAAMAKARTEGETAAKDEMKAVIASISPKLTSEAYGPDVKEAGIKAITGEAHISTFETLVVIADRDNEKVKAELAKKESEAAGETPAAGGGDGNDAEAKAKYDARKERFTRQGV